MTERIDPGAPAERTRLAWQRSGFAVLVGIGAVIRFAVDEYHGGRAVALAVAVGALSVVAAVPALVDRTGPSPAVRPALLRLFACSTSLAGLAALLLTLFAPDAWE